MKFPARVHDMGIQSTHPRTLGEVLDANHGFGPGFPALRIIAASAVFLAHSPWLVSNRFDFVYTFSRGQTFTGSMAVGCFFIISGFLVTDSLQKSRSVASFAIKRALRIFPALIVVVALTALLLGPIATTLSLGEYFSNKQFFAYFLNAIFALKVELPGVFQTHNWTVVNASLWSLRYEVLCYLMLPVLGYLGIIANRFVILTITIFVILLGYMAVGEQRVYFIAPLTLPIGSDLHLSVGPALRLAAYFLMGTTLYVWRHRLPFDWRLASLAAVVCIAGLHFRFHDISFPLFGGYATIFLGLNKRMDLSWLREQDYSYGIYIYASPIQQLMIDIFPQSPWWINALASAPLILGCAIISWNCIEKPAMNLKSQLVGLVDARFKRFGKLG